MQLSTLTYGIASAIMIGWLLWIGKPVLLPIIAAIVALYVLSAAAEGLTAVPLLGRAPEWLLRIIVLLGFTAVISMLFFLVITSFTRVAASVSAYETNLDALVARAADMIGIEDEPNWAIVRDATLGQFDATRLVAPLVNSIRGFGATLFLVVLYAAFFFSERLQFIGKLTIALGNSERGDRAVAILTRINERVGSYLLVKTFVNVILGVISFAIMWAIGIEFAPFWAVLIAFMNYVPYVGSLIGVLFPVLLSLVQSASIGFAILSLITLSAAQIYVGGVLEPRLMGRTFNLSPAVVLLALAFWGALWGIAGAILAVPLTVSLVIVIAEIDETRPAAVMLSARGRI